MMTTSQLYDQNNGGDDDDDDDSKYRDVDEDDDDNDMYGDGGGADDEVDPEHYQRHGENADNGDVMRKTMLKIKSESVSSNFTLVCISCQCTDSSEKYCLK